MMAGVRLMAVGAVDSHHSAACLCVDSFPISSKLISFRSPTAASRRSQELNTAFVPTWNGHCPLSLSRRKQHSTGRRRNSARVGHLVVFNGLGGQYEEGFEDVHKQMINYFTYKATRTVLHQLYEMNPPKYRWMYNFVAANNPNDSKRFLRELGKEKQDLAERVMITRLHLYSKWIKKCDHAKMYERISQENLELMRERLMETVIWPSDDTNSEMIG